MRNSTQFTKTGTVLRAAVLACLTGSALTLSGCGSDDTVAVSTASNPLAEAMPSLAITSPTASATSAQAQLQFQLKHSLWARLQHNFFQAILPSSVADATTDAIKPLDTMVSELASDITSAAPATMAAKVGEMSAESRSASCYGVSWTDNARGTSVSRPGSDTGIVYATASDTDTMACAAAQLNALMQGGPNFANKVIKLQATMIVALKAAGKSLPEVGAEVDALADMPAMTGITLTTAKIARLANDADGNKVFKTSFAFANAKGKTGAVTIYHTPLNAENTNFKGLIRGVLPHTDTMGGVGDKRGLSVVYSQVDKVLTFALDTGANRGASSEAFFNATTGRLDYTLAGFGEDAHKIIAKFDENTKESIMHYAWQAGGQDGHVRSFAVQIAAGTPGSQTGVAYFGFGDSIQSITDSVSTLWAKQMHCDWLNGVTNSVAQANLVQAQTFKQSGSDVFIPVTNHIAYAPNDNCVMASSPYQYTVTNASSAFLNGTYTVQNHALVAPKAQGDVASVTVPTFTLPAGE